MCIGLSLLAESILNWESRRPPLPIELKLTVSVVSIILNGWDVDGADWTDARPVKYMLSTEEAAEP